MENLDNILILGMLSVSVIVKPCCLIFSSSAGLKYNWLLSLFGNPQSLVSISQMYYCFLSEPQAFHTSVTPFGIQTDHTSNLYCKDSNCHQIYICPLSLLRLRWSFGQTSRVVDTFFQVPPVLCSQLMCILSSFT